MEKACVTSPTSDEKLWSKLRSRAESIVEDLNTNSRVEVSANQSVALERSKRLREDSMLLLKGLDSVSSTLSKLSETLDSAQQGADSLANSIQDEEPRAKRNRTSTELTEKFTLKDSLPPSDNSLAQNEEDHISDGAVKSSNLTRARMLAVSMANKAAFLSREIKSVKSELNFMQERCNHLEEENRKLREEGYDRGASHDDDDLLRLQVEALLAEKSRLAHENANLTRENKSLQQLVEYHQLTSQDLFASFEEIEGLCMDFNSPVVEENEGEDQEETAVATPTN